MRSLPFLLIMKLLFDNINVPYNGFDSYQPVLVGSSWVGIASVEDKFAKTLLKENGVTELSEEDFDWYKKKVLEEAVTFRKFSTLKQQADRSPLADYAEEEKSGSSKSPSPKGKAKAKANPKDMIRTEAVDAETVEEK